MVPAINAREGKKELLRSSRAIDLMAGQVIREQDVRSSILTRLLAACGGPSGGRVVGVPTFRQVLNQHGLAFGNEIIDRIMLQVR